MDYAELLRIMEQERYKKKDIAKIIKKSRATVSLIFKGKRFLLQDEIILIANALNIKKKDIGRIFFTTKV